MKLSKDQKNILFSTIIYIVLAIGFNALLVVFGKKTWDDVWPILLGMLIGAVVLDLLLIIGSRIPKKKEEDKE